jgi:hypothetical protein
MYAGAMRAAIQEMEAQRRRVLSQRSMIVLVADLDPTKREASILHVRLAEQLTYITVFQEKRRRFRKGVRICGE